ncbi:MAG: hypothetical protein HW421_1198 [Ignavibacteria bacterium]|nr:hypothetical protein [Ignavibacteria bacterium]
MKKIFLTFLLLGIIYENSISKLVDSTSNWRDSKYLNSLQVSPFYNGDDLPNSVRSLSIMIESMKWALGGMSLGICTNPSKEDYFNLLVQALSIGTLDNAETTNNNIKLIDDFFENAPEMLGVASGSLEQIENILRSAQMKSVRSRNGGQASFYYQMFKKVKSLKEYSSRFGSLLSSAGTIKDALKLIATTSQPLVYYKDAELAFSSMLKYGDNLPLELRQAITDCLGLIRQEKNNYITNISIKLQNNQKEILNLGINLGKQILSDNQEALKKYAVKFLGIKSVRFLSDFMLAREVMYGISKSFLPLDDMSKYIPGTFTAACTDVCFHKIIFGAIRAAGSQEEFKASLRMLLLIESIVNSNAASLLSAASKIQDFSAVINEANNASKECIEAFSELDLCGNK